MADTLEPKYLDKRTLPRYVRTGQVEEKALEKHLKGLPDLSDRTVVIETVMDDEDEFDSEPEESAEG